ncbi:MAG: right-handed parallel beta-helix repeat-containing protein [Planctomycetes bacterium]|nr:right-handed parallel beta-helix repeat-containing protein [Planctomycetota bacterium]
MGAFFLLCTFQCLPCLAREYHIDSQKQFDALCTTAFGPGDTILFKRGMQFDGMFAPSGNGTEQAPVRIDVYGYGQMPKINAGGKHIAGVFLQDPSYWEVNGLEIANTDGTDKDQGQLFGIYVLAKGAEGAYKHIYINDCYIHDVNGKVAGKGRGGIHVHVKGLDSSTFHDLRITNNRIVRVGGVGIGNSSSCGRVEFREHDTVAHNLWTKVYVAGNYIDRTGRNNVIARTSKDAVYEHNVLANSSRYDTGHSIFCFNTDGIKIQYNEAYGNVGNDGRDRGGYDADYNCVNTFIQYNYSHDNMWFCGIMKRRNRNVVIRYNVSQNDKKGIYFYGFENERKATGIHIYNNTHFVGKDFDVSVFPEGRTPINSLFENNIFFFEGQGKWGAKADGINTSFHNNLYFNIPPHKSDTSPITANPMLVRPGIAGADIDLKTMAALRGYRLKPNSPCIDTGVKIKNHGRKDLLRTKVTIGKADVGAFERD